VFLQNWENYTENDWTVLIQKTDLKKKKNGGKCSDFFYGYTEHVKTSWFLLSAEVQPEWDVQAHMPETLQGGKLRGRQETKLSQERHQPELSAPLVCSNFFSFFCCCFSLSVSHSLCLCVCLSLLFLLLLLLIFVLLFPHPLSYPSSVTFSRMFPLLVSLLLMKKLWWCGVVELHCTNNHNVRCCASAVLCFNYWNGWMTCCRLLQMSDCVGVDCVCVVY